MEPTTQLLLRSGLGFAGLNDARTNKDYHEVSNMFMGILKDEGRNSQTKSEEGSGTLTLLLVGAVALCMAVISVH
ncbi:MAG: hypothetical protein NTY96_00300 [Bacteroidetes bacterium]|nr:hypothetical protein [Bacteroidota bacterium]